MKTSCHRFLSYFDYYCREIHTASEEEAAELQMQFGNYYKQEISI